MTYSSEPKNFVRSEEVYFILLTLGFEVPWAATDSSQIGESTVWMKEKVRKKWEKTYHIVTVISQHVGYTAHEMDMAVSMCRVQNKNVSPF